MVRNTLDVEVSRPVDEVFAYVDDDAKLRQWVTGILESSRAPGPARPGASFRQVVDLGNGRLELQGELTEYEPNRVLAVRLRSRLCDMDVRYEFEPRNGSTVIHYVCDSRYHKWLHRLLSSIVKRIAQKKLEADFGRLRQLLASPRRSATAAPELA
jgi:uncharacterized protein YndB with AHSA1/START domain